MVKGEVYEINDYILANLDWLESVPTLYTRAKTEVTLDDGETVQAYIYVGNGFNRYPGPLIESGDWRTV